MMMESKKKDSRGKVERKIMRDKVEWEIMSTTKTTTVTKTKLSGK